MFFSVELNFSHCLLKKDVDKTRKAVSEKKLWTAPASLASIYSGQGKKKGQSASEVAPFSSEEHLEITCLKKSIFNCLKDSRERGCVLV